MKPILLKTEHLIDPIGIDATRNRPRFSWICQSTARGDLQTGYRILIASSLERLGNDDGNLWDSGQMNSDASNGIVYAGTPLHSTIQCHWKVKLWDGAGKPTDWSEVATFEMGLLEASDWGGDWIGRQAFGSQQLRREFALEKPIARARAYVSGLGDCEFFLNGRRVGDHLLDPAPTRIGKTVLYSTYDVTDYLGQGANAAGAVLGHSWAACPRTAPKRGIGWYLHGWFGSAHHGFPKLRVRVEIEFLDGSKSALVSEENWKCCPSPTVDDCHFYGDTYDARLETPGWDKPHYDDSDWQYAEIVAAPGGAMRAQMMPPIRVVETIKPTAMTQPAEGVTVFHFPRNVAGWTRLKVEGPRGTLVQLQHSERLGEDGRIGKGWFAGDTQGLDGRVKHFQTNSYILKGEGREEWEPRFTYHGFQYVEVTDFPGTPTLESIEARVLHNDLQSIGSFECSNKLLNRIHELTCVTFLNNAHGILTDTPVYEKAPWLGDALLIVKAALYNFDAQLFFEKAVRDQADQLVASGHLGGQAPKGEDADPKSRWGADWEACFLQMPWETFTFGGDQRLLSDFYDAYKLHTDYEIAHVVDGVNASFWGDWLAPDGMAPIPEVSGTAYTYRIVSIMEQIAATLGHEDDARHYGAHAKTIAAGFNARFFDETRGIYRIPGDTRYFQTANLLPMAFGMVPDDKRAAVAAGLAAHADKLQTGIHGTRYLGPVLTDTGAGDAAYAIATGTEYPSWGHWIEHGGATALFEVWERDGNRSRNHFMFGSIDEWFYSHLAGITPLAPGFKQICIKPYPVGDLTFARAHTDTANGTVAAYWKKSDASFQLEVTIPTNTSAQVWVPAASDGEVCEGKFQPASRAQGVMFIGAEDNYVGYRVGSGTYNFTVSVADGSGFALKALANP